MNFKVKCVGYNAHERKFTIGKVYEVKNGEITRDDGYTYTGWGETFHDLNRRLDFWYKFELVKDEPKCKFKVGDKIRANRLSDKVYVETCYSKKWTGEVAEIGSFGFTEGERDDIEIKDQRGDKYSVNSKYFDLIEESPEIHITVKGNETIAIYKNGTEYKKAVAKCSPEDTFDFGVGAKLALERLGVLPTTEPVVEDKPLKLIIDEGDCGTVGEPTGYKDVYGKPLFVGDVVTHFSKNTQHDFGETVIVHRRNKFFVMGIEASCNDKEWTIDPDWVIVKVKDHSEMKRGDKVFHEWVKYV